MLNNISKFTYCYGCGVCAAACPKHVINLHLDVDGFYTPAISDVDNCINCGICLDVCAFNHTELAYIEKNVHSWAAWSNDEEVRKRCSSGGVGFEIGKQLIEQGYEAVGCRYDTKKQRAEHYISTTVDEFMQSIGSKYIQSYTEEAFRNIQIKNKQYLVIGTPCQIDSFRRMIRRYRCEDNFILMDFFCHCVPSMHAWNAYMKMLEPKLGKVTYASWRNKYNYGWHDSWVMTVEGTKSLNCSDSAEGPVYQSRMSKGDLFYQLFLGDFCLGPQCQYECKYKYDKSSADIRIGDLWGDTYEADDDGVSALISFTDKGYSVINSLKHVTLIEHPFGVVAEGQMKYNAQSKPFSRVVMTYLKSGKSINTLYFKGLLISLKILSRIKRIFVNEDRSCNNISRA